jgi:hypothetical protein
VEGITSAHCKTMHAGAVFLQFHDRGRILLLHTWHSYIHFQHRHLLGSELTSNYPHCGALLNISDILLECELYNEGRHTCGTH